MKLEENDSPFLLHPHKRGLQNLDRMARYDEGAPVDLVVVGAGAGGVTLAQRLARKGWKIVIVERGPFWDPDRDWVSDEKGSGGLYWTDNRIIGGSDPIEMGKNNSGLGGEAERWEANEAVEVDPVPETKELGLD